MDIKISDAVKQAKTLTPFEVMFCNELFEILLRFIFVGNIWRLFDYL
jgi:hypothetical protein